MKQASEDMCAQLRQSRTFRYFATFSSKNIWLPTILRHNKKVSLPRNMVQFRGININVVSQFDAKRLPEHSTARAFDDSGTVVACYIPIYAGAQIWLEYSIDGPHPPKAAYFFKMLINGQVVTSWVSQTLTKPRTSC